MKNEQANSSVPFSGAGIILELFSDADFLAVKNKLPSRVMAAELSEPVEASRTGAEPSLITRPEEGVGIQSGTLKLLDRPMYVPVGGCIVGEIRGMNPGLRLETDSAANKNRRLAEPKRRSAHNNKPAHEDEFSELLIIAGCEVTGSTGDKCGWELDLADLEDFSATKAGGLIKVLRLNLKQDDWLEPELPSIVFCCRSRPSIVLVFAFMGLIDPSSSLGAGQAAESTTLTIVDDDRLGAGNEELSRLEALGKVKIDEEGTARGEAASPLAVIRQIELIKCDKSVSSAFDNKIPREPRRPRSPEDAGVEGVVEKRVPELRAGRKDTVTANLRNFERCSNQSDCQMSQSQSAAVFGIHCPPFSLIKEAASSLLDPSSLGSPPPDSSNLRTVITVVDSGPCSLLIETLDSLLAERLNRTVDGYKLWEIVYKGANDELGRIYSGKVEEQWYGLWRDKRNYNSQTSKTGGTSGPSPPIQVETTANQQGLPKRAAKAHPDSEI
ncbi:hypothetical protein PPACK8108_LOCUS21877 [Phakopsora pachyrhizi]|uniref:Uncharacterized protein n=1 Tax=Phakopsora pachyrhizi TaxID=170000 RepID=A0AAV0BLF1_PHAPC|nr:hypothetical protein PPACK8108_LOCUS21877 [Phakopsora pachyrhizi]